jgi:hypothetical protein
LELIHLFSDAHRKQEYIKYLEKELGITSEEDWKSINLEKVNLPPHWGYFQCISNVIL